MDIKNFVTNQKNYVVHIVREDETIEEICELYKTTKQRVFADSNIDKIHVGSALLIKLDGEHTYIVKPLDTPTRVAKKFNTTAEELCRINSCKAFFIGQKIMLREA